MIITIIFIFVLGLFIGSFLNVLIDRGARNEDFIRGRSYCESCHHPLIWNDLFPLYSFISLRGKCRYCGTKIPFWLPIVELVTGSLFVAVVFLLPSLSIGEIIFCWLIVSVLIVIFFTDAKYQLVYQPVVLIGLLFTLLYRLIYQGGWAALVSPLLTALSAGLFFYLLYLLTKKKGLGLGDVQIAILVGLLLGFPAGPIALYLAFLLGAIVGILLIIAGRVRLKTAIAFGPFLIASTLTVWLSGSFFPNLVSRYLPF